MRKIIAEVLFYLYTTISYLMFMVNAFHTDQSIGTCWFRYILQGGRKTTAFYDSGLQQL